MTIPRFADLPVRPGAPAGASWGVFGDDDELGTINFIEPRHVKAAGALVRMGAVFSLNWDLSLPNPALFHRKNFEHHVFARREGNSTDEIIDGFYPQVSSQWDGLRHFSDGRGHFYNGASIDDVTAADGGRLGIEHWAKRGIVGRGVLLDVARFMETNGTPLDPFDPFTIGTDLLLRTAQAQDVAIQTGDILLIRTGWVEAYLGLSLDERRVLVADGSPGSAGLYGADVPSFLWDLRVAAVAADNPGLEPLQPGIGADHSIHTALLAGLGMPIGELWYVASLAADCAKDGVFEFLLTAAPLHVRGGVGSPANALAIK